MENSDVSTKTQKINYLSRWKLKLDSEDPKTRLVALHEIVEMLDNLEPSRAKCVYKMLINSDICHFIAESMSYERKESTNLGNKIICHLSEIDEFFKNDFFRVLRGYTRVINSFPTEQSTENEEKYQQNILACLVLVVKRAKQRDCSFASEEMPLNCLIITISGISEHHLRNIAVLDFISVLIEIMTSFPAPKAEDELFRNYRLFVLLKKLNFLQKDFESPTFTLHFAEILHNVLKHIPKRKSSPSATPNALLQVLIEKFLDLMEFCLSSETETAIFEIFCNMFYYFLTSEKLEMHQTMNLLNVFFILDGHEKYLKTTKDEALNFNGKTKTFLVMKSKFSIVMAEVLNVFLKFTSATFQVDQVPKSICYKIVFNAKIDQLIPIKSDMHQETLQLYIFLKFVEFVYKKPTFKRNEVVSNFSLILAAINAKLVSIEPPFLSLMTHLFTSTFKNISIRENVLLQIASSELLKSVANVKRVDLKYLKWWKEMGNPKLTQLNGVVMNFFKQGYCQELENLEPRFLNVFEQAHLLTAFLEVSNFSEPLHSNLKSVLCNFTKIETADYRRLLEMIQRLHSTKPLNGQTFQNVMEVINAYVRTKDEQLKAETAGAILPLFNKSATPLHLKVLAIEIASQLFDSGFVEK